MPKPKNNSTNAVPNRPTFDADYYNRFYEDPATRAVSQAEQRRQAEFIAAYLDYLDLEVGSVLDIGCGIGTLLRAVQSALASTANRKDMLGAQIAKKDPVSAVGVEISDYLCDKYGWIHSAIGDYAGPGADLVVCNDVLGYLNKRDARKAIRKLAKLSRQALYFSVITLDDLDICDQEHTDMSQALRPADWYKVELGRYFVSVGGGLFLKAPLSVPVWHLERV